MANLVNTTRGASYSNFPRNTKERFLRTCAQEAREAEKRQREVEAAYAEYAPTQVFHEAAMDEADLTHWNIEVQREDSEIRKRCAAELGIDLSGTPWLLGPRDEAFIRARHEEAA